MTRPAPRVIAVGASAGGVQALQTLVSGLPADLPAALLVVLHIGSHPSILSALLAKRGPLPAKNAVDGEPILAGRIYVAAPDRHLLVDGHRLRLSRGPKEHHTRPAVDPLFRSAALALGPEMVGVVLTGWLDDGTAGLQAIKACGGLAVVQSPEDAQVPSMPASALRYVAVDHSVPIASMAALLASLARAPPAAHAARARKDPLAHEHALALSQGNPMDHLQAIGKPSPFVCPECRGGLWLLEGEAPPRFRCHTGHAYTLRTLQHAQGEATDEALWGALRALQERQMLLHELQVQQREQGEEQEVAKLEAQVKQLAHQADLLRRLVERVPERAL
jgi:two-component system chemotaxis response regulator CheB